MKYQLKLAYKSDPHPSFASSPLSSCLFSTVSSIQAECVLFPHSLPFLSLLLFLCAFLAVLLSVSLHGLGNLCALKSKELLSLFSLTLLSGRLEKPPWMVSRLLCFQRQRDRGKGDGGREPQLRLV